MSENRTTRSQHILLSAQVVRLVLSLAITAYLGRNLSPVEFGFFSLISIIFTLSYELIDLGSGSIATREVSQNPEQERAFLLGLLSWRRLIGMVLSLLCACMAIFGYPEQPLERSILLAVAASILLLHLNAFSIVFQVRQRYGKVVLIGLFSQLLFFLFSALLIAQKLAGLLIGLLVIVRELMIVMGIRFLAVEQLGYRPRAALFDGKLKLMFARAWTFTIAALIYNLYFPLGAFFIWSMSAPEELGSFTASYRIISPVIPLTWTILLPLIPLLSSLAVADNGLFKRIGHVQWKLFVGIVGIFLASGYILAPAILAVLYGDHDGGNGLSSTEVFRWLVAALSCSVLTSAVIVFLLAKKQERFLLRISVVGMAINVAGHLLLVPEEGALGSAKAITITEFTLLIFSLCYSIYSGIHKINVGSWLPYLLPAATIIALPALVSLPALAMIGTTTLVAGIGTLVLWNSREQRHCRDHFADFRVTLNEV